MTEKFTALQLADWLDVRACGGDNWNAKMNAAAAELRRLHAENELLGRACDKIRLMHRDEIRPLLNVHTVNSELLEALKLMRSRFLDVNGDHGAWEQEATDAADAAIAKAEGKV